LIELCYDKPVLKERPRSPDEQIYKEVLNMKIRWTTILFHSPLTRDQDLCVNV